MEQLRAAAHAGGAVLAIMHDLALAAHFADGVLVMDAGHIVTQAPPAEALSVERIASVFGVEAVFVETDARALPIALRPL
jgi:iron complex transport system ATP-binding protein